MLKNLISVFYISSGFSSHNALFGLLCALYQGLTRKLSASSNASQSMAEAIWQTESSSLLPMLSHTGNLRRSTFLPLIWLILGQCQIVKTWQKRILNDMQIINIIRKFTNVFDQPLGRDRTKVCKISEKI
jgi:hypothetical protein